MKRACSVFFIMLCFFTAVSAFAEINISEPFYYDHVHNATYYYEDILDKSPEWKERALHALEDISGRMGVKGKIRDIGIAGSLAAGIARPAGSSDPSDIDFVIILAAEKGMIDSMEFKDKLGSLLPEYRKRMKKELDTLLKIDIDFFPLEQHTLDDKDHIYFSLSTDTMYGRPEGKRKNVKYVWFENRWHRFDRTEFKRVTDEVKKRMVLQKLDEEGGMVYYIENTGEVILRSVQDEY